jgi:acyl-CoA thioester hydrolase
VRSQGVLQVDVELEVRFHDVDMAGVVWHGHYLRYFENARWALMDRLDYGFVRMVDSGYAWPIVDLQARYLSPARFGDRLRVRCSLVEWQSRLVLNYLVSRLPDVARVARARTVQVAVDGRTGELQFATPPDFVARVHEVLAQGAA